MNSLVSSTTPSSSSFSQLEEYVYMALQKRMFPLAQSHSKICLISNYLPKNISMNVRLNLCSKDTRGQEKKEVFTQFIPFHFSIFIPATVYFSEDLLWYLWCMAILYHFFIELCFNHLIEFMDHHSNIDSLLCTFLEWFS